ncbi:MAG: sel1 repeat family protein [Planctomycetes bacterium]|nr:sel1 repeat family protein [Planctomycetota bacterium]
MRSDLAVLHLVVVACLATSALAQEGRPWPPRKGEPFPALELTDLQGRRFQLSTLRGKVLLIEPVLLGDPVSQAYAGGNLRGGFGGVAPAPDQLSLDELLGACGVSSAHPDLLRVQLLVRGSSGERPPTLDEARAWAAHFRLDARPNTHVLVAAGAPGARLAAGLWLVGRDLRVIADGTGPAPPDDVNWTLMPQVAELLAGERPPPARPTRPPAPVDAGAPEPPAAPAAPRAAPVTRQGGLFVPPADPTAFPELAERVHVGACLEGLDAGRFGDVDATLARVRAAGRRAGDHAPALDRLVAVVAAEPAARVQAPLSAWVKQQPRSPLAHLLWGEFNMKWAWEARGSGYADTVTAEGWRLFKERLEVARAALERAAELDRRLARAPAILIKVAMGLRLGAEEEQRHLDEALRRDPRHVLAHELRLQALMPKWSGNDPRVMFDFVQASARRRPDEPALAGLVLDVHWELSRLAADREGYLRDPRVRESVEAAHAAVFAAYPRSADACWMRMCVTEVVRDEAAFQECLRHCADAGLPTAQDRLARALRDGRSGQAQDLAAAAEWAWRAAMQDHPGGMTTFGALLVAGRGVRPDPQAGFRWVERAALRGHLPAALELGTLYERGAGGVAPDRQKAREWYTRAAASTHAPLARAAQAGLERLRDR